MKPIFSKIRVLGTAALALFLTASCSDILDEQPRSSYDPTFFKTEKDFNQVIAEAKDIFMKLMSKDKEKNIVKINCL